MDLTVNLLLALLLQSTGERPDLTINYIIIAVLLVVAAILSVIVVRRRMRERDDDWDV
jgi:DMSO/TMAO reductase YedYZ heme-binding membrane subunit